MYSGDKTGAEKNKTSIVKLQKFSNLSRLLRWKHYSTVDFIVSEGNMNPIPNGKD